MIEHAGNIDRLVTTDLPQPVVDDAASALSGGGANRSRAYHCPTLPAQNELMTISASSPPKMFTLVLLTALSVLSLNMFLPSLSNMAQDFEVGYSLIALSIAGYLGVAAALMLIMGPMSDRVGGRPVLLLALTVFTLASLVCALSTNIWVFLGFRVLQGAIIAGWALSLAIIRDMLPPRQAASKIGFVTMAMGIAPMLAPMFGGALDELLGWRAKFAVFILFGVAVLGLCWIDLTGAVLTPQNGAYALQAIMLSCAMIALAAALYVRRIDRLEGQERPNFHVTRDGISH